MSSRPRPFRVRHLVLLAAVFVISAVVVIGLKRSREPVWEPDTQFLFHGRISGLGWVNAFVSLDGRAATVELNADDGRFASDLSGDFQNGQLTAQELDWIGENTSRLLRTLDATLTDSPLSLQGTLTESATGQARSFDLQPVARYWTLRQEQGFQVFNRGWSMTARVSIPEFQEPAELAAETMEWLREEARASLQDAFAEFKPGWRERMHYYRWSMASGQWEFHSVWRVEHHSPRIISLRNDSHHYAGGAHGNLSTKGQTWWRHEGDVLGVELRDLFSEHSGWETNLQATVLRDLAGQKRQRGIEGVTAENIQAEIFLDGAFAPFTVNANGIAFYFDPYVAGSYAEGRYRVFVPFTELEPCLRTDGPMADLRAMPDRGGR